MKPIQLHKTAGLTLRQIEMELANGATFVIYGYCISIIALTFRLTSHPYLIRAGERRSLYRLKYNLITCFFGWWGIPRGIEFSIRMLRVNSEKRIVDVTNDVVPRMKKQLASVDREKILDEDLRVNYQEPELTTNTVKHNSGTA